jgi:hypothetical protein
MPDRHVLAIPMGDPAGIGPEIISRRSLAVSAKACFGCGGGGSKPVRPNRSDCALGMPFDRVVESRAKQRGSFHGCRTILLHMPSGI